MGFYTKDSSLERDVSREFSYEQVWQELVLDKTYTAKDKQSCRYHTQLPYP